MRSLFFLQTLKASQFTAEMKGLKTERIESFFRSFLYSSIAPVKWE